jgi:uridine monophosphate synthetase
MENDMQYIKSLKNILLNKLYHLDIIKNGSFNLKNGTASNIYIDFRKLINYPQLFDYLEILIDLMFPELFIDTTPIIPTAITPTAIITPTSTNTNTSELVNETPAVKLMPIPMGGLPLGNYLSFAKCIPQVMIRDKPKAHGTKNIIEGIYSDKDEFIIIEDVITSGTSVKESLQNLFDYGITNLKYKAALCICNRGSLEKLDILNRSCNISIPIYSIFTLKEIEDYLVRYNLFAPINYFANQYKFSNELYKLATMKKSNIILSCDFMNDKEIISMIDRIGNKIVAVKLHLDTVKINNEENNNNYYQLFIDKLKELKQKHNLLIIEDAKFADIETIMYEKIYASRMIINKIADAITIHAVAGLSILEQNNNSQNIKIPMIIVSEMSSLDNMIDIEYSKKIINKIRNIPYTIEKQSGITFVNHSPPNPSGNPPPNISGNQPMLSMHSSLLGGLVCQHNVSELIKPFEFLTMTPGVNLEFANDSGNQKYSIPAVKNNKVGLFWIVGRGITKYKDNLKILQSKMELYKETGWQYFITY